MNLKDSSFSELIKKEWLETNGLGGWSSSTVCGCNTRGYHGILVSAPKDPANRFILLSRLDESVGIAGSIFNLASRDFKDAVYPDGYKLLENFSCDPCPNWTYSLNEVKFKKTLLCLPEKNSVCIKYELNSSLEGSLSLEPFLAFRDYHSRQNAGNGLTISAENSGSSVLIKDSNQTFCLNFQSSQINYEHTPCWHYNFYYSEEAARGLSDREDLLMSGKLCFQISRDKPVYLLISDNDETITDVAKLFEAQFSSRLGAYKSDNRFIDQLKKSSSQFIVKRAERKTVIAGYHWFADWGRDTLIALRGLTISQQKFAECKEILELFCSHIKDGLIPNRFIEGDFDPEYNSVDASLWLSVVAYEYYKNTNDPEFCHNVLFKALNKIYRSFKAGTIYDIREAEDGLLYAGNKDLQLTWMDAKIGDWVVTPRYGKAVEINALWFNFLNVLKTFAEKFWQNDLAKELKSKIEKVKESFEKAFYNNNLNCLYDVVRDDLKDPAIRPNQIFATGLEFCPLSHKAANEVISTVRTELLTPKGLRTLSPEDPAYRGEYSGSPFSRDSAYHQGTVWPWLLGLYVDSLFKFQPVTAKQEASGIISQLKPHLQEACLGSISEIFDGDFPHHPRGAVSQAWSVAEILRVSYKYSI